MIRRKNIQNMNRRHLFGLDKMTTYDANRPHTVRIGVGKHLM